MSWRCIMVGAAILGGCTLAPHYEAPQVAAADPYKEVGDWVKAEPADGALRGDWWHAFGDQKLDELQLRLRDSNPDLAAAVARFDQARALALSSRSNIFPSIGAQSAVTRERVSASAPTNSLHQSVTYNDFVAGLNLSWEIDVFGRLRSAARAAGDRAQASAADLAAANLSLRAELATDYFSLRGEDSIVKLLDDTEKDYQRALEITRNRYNGGIAAATDVDRAETQLQTALAQTAASRLRRAQYEHAIAVLLGQVPASFSLPAAAFIGDPPPLQVNLPSTLLQRRPDVASAERAVAAANAEIGVARAGWFPVFSLGGSGGYESNASSGWLQAPNAFWSLGPKVQLPFLDAGTRVAANRAARAAYNEAVANYRSIALNAYREVEDNLAALHHLADELKSQEAASASAQRSVYHSDQSYQAGVADYLEVATAQTSALQAQQAALEARVARMNAAVGLVRAMGGGWSTDQLDRVAVR